MKWIKNLLSKKEPKKVICPNCGSDKIRTIIYGLLKFKTEEEQDEFLKKHFPGGCCISKDSPHFYCDNCDTKF